MNELNYGLRENKVKNKLFSKFRMYLFSISLAALFLVFSVKTTQEIAKEFSYNKALGVPLIGHFYSPHKWLVWRNSFKADETSFNKIIRRNAIFAGLILFTPLLLMIFLKRKKNKKDSDIHGSARTASMDDIKLMGILDNDGVVIGSYTHKKKNYFLRHDGPEHVVGLAPTRSGKGVSLVLPTLLSWPHSVVVYDIKKENWHATASWRQQHANNIVMRFEPACNDSSAARFNPLQEIRIHTDWDVADAQNIANMLVDDGEDTRPSDPHWNITATDLLTGLILHLCYVMDKQGESASLNDVAAELSNPDRPIDELFLDMLNDEHTVNGNHPVIAQSARSIADKPEKERGSVISTAMSKLILYRDPIVSKNIAVSDFKLNDIVNSNSPVSLYICVSPADQDRIRPLTRLLLTMIVQKLAPEIQYENGRPKQVHKQRLLMMIDEFPSLGKLPIMEKSLAFLAGYGIKCYLIIQDFAQLRKYYGREESIISNCHIRIVFAPNKQETAEELSKMTGVTTITKKDVSISKSRSGAFNKKRYSTSIKEQQRYLFTPDEVKRLKPMTKNPDGSISPGEMLIFISGQHVIYGDQILYFNNSAYSARAKLGAPDKSDRIRS